MQHMPLFQSEMFIMRIPGRSNISRKIFLNKLSNCFANQENEKKNCHYSVWLIILEWLIIIDTYIQTYMCTYIYKVN